MVILKCKCEVTDEGKFIVSNGCANCRECNTISTLHPFGPGRFE
jgi:hypothetical protein